MHGDFTRSRSKPEKHYSDVRMQQGRILLDSDWNEQIDIAAHRRETEAIDVIGYCGGPAEDGGFRIAAGIDDLTDEEKAGLEDQTPLRQGDFIVTRGRYYVDGILIENEHSLKYTGQPDLPGIEPIQKTGQHLVYLDVWKRHISHIEDPGVREVALSGPDTTTRVKTVWQVRAKEVLPEFSLGDDASLPPGSDCKDLIGGWPKSSEGRLSTGLVSVPDEDKPCQITPRGGYQGLENHLYRVEIHDGCQPYAWPRPEDTEFAGASLVPEEDRKIHVDKWEIEDRPWGIGQFVEVFNETETADVAGTLAQITDVDEAESNLTLSEKISGLSPQGLSIRRVATFKWSRDNGSIAFAIDEFVLDDPGKDWTDRVRISPLGRDKALSLRPGCFVEFLSDEMELRGEPGILARVMPAPTGEFEGVMNLSVEVPVLKKEVHPKLRRWDQAAEAVLAVKYEPMVLEAGIQVKFSGTDFKAGDYWTFYARTLTGEVERLEDEPPQGIEHHYCELSVIQLDQSPEGPNLRVIKDCRRIFPPLTGLTGMFYIGGGGQEAMPKHTLDHPLQIRVSNGIRPVGRAPIRFEVVEGGGSLSVGDTETNQDGIAECIWTLGDSGKQRVKAVYRDLTGNQIGLPIFFNADLSIASEVSYDPKNCPRLSSARTVQDAIDILCKQSPAGGCMVSVGRGGKYEDLNKALLDLLEGQGNEEKDICICMLPGLHKLSESPNISGEGTKTNLTIIGCGRGTRIIFARKPWIMDNLNAVTLKDLDIEALDVVSDAIIFSRCGEVVVESCHIQGGMPSEGTLVDVTEAVSIRLENNTLVAFSDRDVHKTTALALSRVSGDVAIINNRIAGALSLYGKPAITILDDDQKIRDVSKLLALRLREGNVSLSFMDNIVQVQYNHLTMIRMGKEIIDSIQAAIDGQGGTIDRIFKHIFLSDNVIDIGHNQWLAREVRLTSNRLDHLDGEGVLGIVIAENSVFVGNSSDIISDMRLSLFDIFRGLQEAANGSITIERFQY